MKLHRWFYRRVAVAVVGALVLGAVGTAQAREVFWSAVVGSPGVQLNASNAAPLVYSRPAPRLVYVPQAVVVIPSPQVGFGSTGVFYVPQPYFVVSGWEQTGFRHGWGPRHHGHGGQWDRHGRDREDGRYGQDGAVPGRGHR